MRSPTQPLPCLTRSPVRLLERRAGATGRPSGERRQSEVMPPLVLVDREQLLEHLRSLGNPLLFSVSWNNERISLSEALRRAESLPSAAKRIAVRDDLIFVAN